MLGFTALSHSRLVPAPGSGAFPLLSARDGQAHRRLEVHRSVVPEGAFAGASGVGVPGERQLLVCLRGGAGDLLEVASLLLDEDGFGTLRYRLVEDVEALVLELRGLGARGARLLVAHDGGARSGLAVDGLAGRCAEVIRLEDLAPTGEEWGWHGEAAEEQAFRASLVAEFREGRSAAGHALLEYAETDVLALRERCARAVAVDHEGVSAPCGWFRTLVRRGVR